MQADPTVNLSNQNEDEYSMQQDENIEIPPPMDCLSSEKIVVNGQQEVLSSAAGPVNKILTMLNERD